MTFTRIELLEISRRFYLWLHQQQQFIKPFCTDSIEMFRTQLTFPLGVLVRKATTLRSLAKIPPGEKEWREKRIKKDHKGTIIFCKCRTTVNNLNKKNSLWKNQIFFN